MATIHTYGSSNTYGLGDPQGGGYAARLRSTMIERILSPVEGQRTAVVHNLARFAMKLPDIVEMLPSSLANRDGRGRLIATVMPGICDVGIPEGATDPEVPLSAFCQSLKEFTAVCDSMDYPVLPLFIEAQPLDLSRPHPKNPGTIDLDLYAEYRAAVREHAESTQAPFVETHPALINLPEDPLSRDGIHLSTAGHIALHDLLLPVVDNLLAPE